MFRCSNPQGHLFQTSNLLPDDKRARLEQEWPGQFRQHALPLINEEQFRELYCSDNGRPNKPVQTIVGVLVLKDMFNLTDEDALYRVDYDLGWQVALNLTPEDAHCCQKTLHNFRAKLLGNDHAKVLFAQMTDKMLANLGLSTERQRLDSTHIVSNIARLTRLGLFCETMRVFLRDLKQSWPTKFEQAPVSLRQRYLKEDGVDTPYHDAKSTETQRRLKVAARDIYRLVDRFKQDRDVLKLVSYKIVVRLFLEQCEARATVAIPEPDDADVQEPKVPVQLKESKEVVSSSLQSPHDIDVTYSGHKGKGYEAQIAETVGNGEKPELITHVEVTPSCKSDEAATVPTVEALAQREIQPKELAADTGYGSADNAIICEQKGTELVAPVKGPAAEVLQKNEKTVADFQVSVKEENAPVVCPAGHAPESQECKANGKIEATYSKLHCAQCPFKKSCPAQRNPNGTRTLKTTTKEYVLDKRRRYEQTEEFRKRYAARAGIEATNSELKRAHGIGRLRVRGGKRVKLAVYFKALACNVKRLVQYLAAQAKKAANQAAADSKTTGAAVLGLFSYSHAPLRTICVPDRLARFAAAA